MSSAVPGSWPPNWLHGTPTTVNPRSAYSSCSFSSPAYCGVRPHLLATLTTRAGRPPVRAPSVVGAPSSVVRGRSRRSLMPPEAPGSGKSFRPEGILPPRQSCSALLSGQSTTVQEPLLPEAGPEAFPVAGPPPARPAPPTVVL